MRISDWSSDVCSSDLYTNDKRIAQAVASMWARIGVKTDVETMAPPVFFKQRNAYAFSTYLAGWAASSGEMLNPLTSLVVTKTPAQGLGTTNWSKYSNPEVDKDRKSTRLNSSH